jgi:hypothetical protein
VVFVSLLLLLLLLLQISLASHTTVWMHGRNSGPCHRRVTG